MGVYHLAGLGTSPGAITVPLSYIYYFLVEAYRNNNLEARNFFSGSGEASGNEQWPGKPEALIIFSSTEIFSGELKPNFCCKLFNIKSDKTVDCIQQYINSLYNHLGIPNEHQIKYIYGIKVNTFDFSDCFKKAYITMKSLSSKEVWVNLVGGANQLNLSLMFASFLTLIPRRLYYVFEWDSNTNRASSYLEPINGFDFQQMSNNWFEIPPLLVDIDRLRDLYNLISQRGAINICELKRFLNQSSLIPVENYIPKLRGSLVNIENDRVTISSLFETVMNLIPQDDEIPQNFSQWKNWAEKNEILYRFFERE